jgi:hypothetical protein
VHSGRAAQHHSSAGASRHGCSDAAAAAGALYRSWLARRSALCRRADAAAARVC